VSTLERDALMALRCDIGFVFQFAALFDSMSCSTTSRWGCGGGDLSDETSRSACARRWRLWT